MAMLNAGVLTRSQVLSQPLPTVRVSKDSRSSSQQDAETDLKLDYKLWDTLPQKLDNFRNSRPETGALFPDVPEVHGKVGGM